MDFDVDNFDTLFFAENTQKSQSHPKPNAFRNVATSAKLPSAPSSNQSLMLSQAYHAQDSSRLLNIRPNNGSSSVEQDEHALLPSVQQPSLQSRNYESVFSNRLTNTNSSQKIGIVTPTNVLPSQRNTKPVFKNPYKNNFNRNISGSSQAILHDNAPSSNTHEIAGLTAKEQCNNVEDENLIISPTGPTNLPVSSQEDLFTTQQPRAFDFNQHCLTYTGATPGGTRTGVVKLKSVNEVPEPYRDMFSFPYFNYVQSKVFDEVFYSDNPVVVCAPTGSGKTVILEIAIIRLLLSQHGKISPKAKIVYMAPMKALCSERFEDWSAKLSPLGLKCMMLTGDSEIEGYFELENVHVILTTPEKWDSMTRRWRDNRSLVQTVRLFLIDEVHTLHDDIRGATMEAVVSRMKTVHHAHSRETNKKDPNNFMKAIRFLAVSATIPNVQDVGDWLTMENSTAMSYNIDESHRPVKLRKVVIGYPASETLSEFRFDLSLNYKIAGIVTTYSDQKPTLVFCATRKGTSQAASIVVKDARFMMNAQHKQRLTKASQNIRDAKLRESLVYGVAFHHAGMSMEDRRLVESLFTEGDIPVLFATSTLAMGVNLPAHLVIIKSTQHYVCGAYEEYSESQILQMIGRAGRPQFDTSATAVIMTRSCTKAKYQSLLEGTQMVESSLHKHLVEHLNAEVVLSTITDVSVALEWIKSTFLYTRVLKNPAHYGIPRGLSDNRLEQKLQELCLKNLNSLATYDLVSIDEDCFVLTATDTGKLMARYCISFDSMKNFHKINGKETLPEILTIFCDSHEFQDIQLRVNEKKILNTYNKDKHRATIRFPMNGKIKSKEMKVNCLIQAQLSSLPVQEFALQQDLNKINRTCLRVAKCLVEVLWQKETHFKALLNTVILAKCMKAKLWDNSKYVSKQLAGIGNILATALVNAGVVSFKDVEERNALSLEMIVNRHRQFGAQVKEAVKHLPKYELTIDQSMSYQTNTAELTIVVRLANAEDLREKKTADISHTCVLLVGDADNKVLAKSRVSDTLLIRNESWTKKLDVTRAKNGDKLSVHYISQDWVGLDVQTTFSPFYSGPKRVTWASTNSVQQNASGHMQESEAEMRDEPNFDLVDGDIGFDLDDFDIDSRISCNHRCSNKDTCGHDCCKFGKKSKKVTETPHQIHNHQCEVKQRLREPLTPTSTARPTCTTRLKIDHYSSRDTQEKEDPPKALSEFAYKKRPSVQLPAKHQGTWDELDLFQLRCKATTEWTLDPREDGDFGERTYEQYGEMTSDIDQEYQHSAESGMNTPLKRNQECVIEDFQTSDDPVYMHCPEPSPQMNDSPYEPMWTKSRRIEPSPAYKAVANPRGAGSNRSVNMCANDVSSETALYKKLYGKTLVGSSLGSRCDNQTNERVVTFKNSKGKLMPRRLVTPVYDKEDGQFQNLHRQEFASTMHQEENMQTRLPCTQYSSTSLNDRTPLPPDDLFGQTSDAGRQRNTNTYSTFNVHPTSNMQSRGMASTSMLPKRKTPQKKSLPNKTQLALDRWLVSKPDTQTAQQQDSRHDVTPFVPEDTKLREPSPHGRDNQDNFCPESWTSEQHDLNNVPESTDISLAQMWQESSYVNESIMDESVEADEVIASINIDKLSNKRIIEDEFPMKRAAEIDSKSNTMSNTLPFTPHNSVQEQEHAEDTFDNIFAGIFS